MIKQDKITHFCHSCNRLQKKMQPIAEKLRYKFSGVSFCSIFVV
jgi:hypothetical protein